MANLKDIENGRALSCPFRGHCEDVETVKAYYHLLHRCNSGNPSGGALMCALLQELLWQNSQHRQQTATSVCEAVQTFVRLTPPENLNLAAVEEQFHYKARYLSQLLRRETGMPLKQLLTQEKMRRARQLLEDTSMQVREIAAYLDYPDAHNFSHAFKAAVSVSPGCYRERRHL